LIIVVMVGYKLGVHIIPKIERNFMNNLSVGLLAMVPYVIIMWQVTRKLNYVSVDIKASYKRLA
jgi:mannose/fructose/N-acetylgalactosamine-specific phosphotransferase system component IID